MILSLIPDPFQLCREALNRFEDCVNSLAANNMDSPRVSQVLLGASRLAAGTRHLSESSRAALYRRLALPTLDEVERIAAAVQRVEDKLDLLLPESAKPARGLRPARTRRPAPEAVGEPAQAVQKKTTLKRSAKPKVTATPLPKAQDATKETNDHVGAA